MSAHNGCGHRLRSHDEAGHDRYGEHSSDVKYYYKAAVGTNAFVEGAATSSTFTTGVASATGLYVVPVTGAMLTDTYKFIRMHCASTANATGALFYIPYNARFPSDPTDLVDSIS